jgi:hypothetical protein
MLVSQLYIPMTIFIINIIHRKSNDTTEYALKVNFSRLIGFARYCGYFLSLSSMAKQYFIESGTRNIS